MIPAVRKLSYWLSKALNLEYSLKLNLRILNIEKRRNCIVQWIYINSFLALFFSFSSLWVKAWPSLQLNWKSWRSEKIPISSHAFLNMRFKTLHLSLIIFFENLKRYTYHWSSSFENLELCTYHYHWSSSFAPSSPSFTFSLTVKSAPTFVDCWN